MRHVFCAVFIAAGLTTAAVPAFAHHSLYAVFDEEQTVTLKLPEHGDRRSPLNPT